MITRKLINWFEFLLNLVNDDYLKINTFLKKSAQVYFTTMSFQKLLR